MHLNFINVHYQQIRMLPQSYLDYFFLWKLFWIKNTEILTHKKAELIAKNENVFTKQPS